MEEKRYFIYAYEGRYCGLHGIYDYCFSECTFQDAEAYGYEMSYSVIESYSFILDELYDEDTPEEEINEAIQEDIVYEIWELRDDAPSFKELEAMNLDPQSYIDDYCKHEQD